jgi:prophage maintenance system killer protein
LLSKDVIIRINKGIVHEWNEQNPQNPEVFAVGEDRLDDVLSMVNKQSGPIEQACYLLAGISWAQPFSGGNKRTAFVCADTWLRMNGYRLVIDSETDQEYLRSLLFEIQESRTDLDDLTLAKIMLYVTKRIRKA